MHICQAGLSEDQLNACLPKPWRRQGEGEKEIGKYFLPLLLSVIIGEACLTNRIVTIP
jgi:hypothetical protein